MIRAFYTDFMKYGLFILIVFASFSASGQAVDKYDKIVDSLKRAGQEGKLIPYFQQEVKSNPKNEKALRWLGFLHIANNQPDIGEKYYNDALAVNPKCARCYMNLGRIYIEKNDNAKALDLFDKSVAVDPNDAILFITRAGLKEFIADDPGALADFNKAIELDPVNTNYLIQRGNYFLSRGNFSDALADLNKAVDLSPENYYAYFRRASVYYSNQMFEAALSDINKSIELNSGDQQLYAARGSIYAALHQDDKANENYSTAISLNPADLLSYKNRALSRYKLEDMDGSCEDYYRVMTLIREQNIRDTVLINEARVSVNDYCDSTKPGYYYQRGLALNHLGQFQKAIDIYSRGLTKNPDNFTTLFLRGNSYMALKNYKGALENYYSALENKDKLMADVRGNSRFAEGPSDKATLYYNGSLASIYISIAICKFAQGLYIEALSAIEKGITLAPDVKDFGKEDFYNVRGNTLLALGKYQKAIEDFEKCIVLNPGFAAAYVNRAVAKVNLANKTRTILIAVKTDIDPGAFNANWSIHYKTVVNESNPDIISALADCDKAIEADPGVAYFYYMRGRIKKLLIYGNYCKDIIKAKDLGYPADVELLNECRL